MKVFFRVRYCNCLFFYYKCKRIAEHAAGPNHRKQFKRVQNTRNRRGVRARVHGAARVATPRGTHEHVAVAAWGTLPVAREQSKTIPNGARRPKHKTTPETRGVHQKRQKYNPKSSPVRRAGCGPQKAAAECAPGRLPKNRPNPRCRSRKKAPEEC